MMISSSYDPNPYENLTEVSSPLLSQNNGKDREDNVTLPEEEQESLALPEPDADNITVLTDKLPNKPILPWNRYDSPWETSEEDSSELVNPDHPILEDKRKVIKLG